MNYKLRNTTLINLEKLNKKHKRDNYLYSIRSDFLSKVIYHVKIEEIIEAIDLFVEIKDSHLRPTLENREAFDFFDNFLNEQMAYYIQEPSSGQASGTGYESGKEFNKGDTVMYIKGDKKEKVIIINIFPDEPPFYDIKFISRNEIIQTVTEFLYIIEE